MAESSILARTYLGASSRHLYCEDYKFEPNAPLEAFNRDEVVPQIMWIDIKNCRGIFNPETFKNLPNLETICLDKCYIEEIRENTFSNIANLKSLNMRKSNFPLDQNLFANCNKMESLRVIQPTFGPIAQLALKGLKNLEYLMISHMLGLRLCQDTFSGLDNLKYLFIQHCQIEEFAEDTFWPLKRLETFYFTDNILKKLDVIAFLNLPNLTLFGFYKNVLESGESPQIDYQQFATLPNLETINFPEETIRALNYEEFKNLRNVQLVIAGQEGEDIADFLKKKNINFQWTSSTDLTEDVDLKHSNIQICA